MFEITLAERFEMAFTGNYAANRLPLTEATIEGVTLRIEDRGLQGRFVVRPGVVAVSIDTEYGLGAVECACHEALAFK